MKTSRRVLYIDKMEMPGWYWTERSGNRVIYIGPFKTEDAARLDAEINTQKEKES